jgi:predicted nucleotidyltransferase
MEVKTAILSTLAYFDMFHYPLKEQEIYFFMPQTCLPEAFHKSLHELIRTRKLFVREGMYTLSDDTSPVKKRLKGNERAARMLITARKIGAFLYLFPFVRSVSISGSLSKHYADVDSDIDLFIITASNRLWIARTLLHLVKKLSFLFGLQDWFCMNYFIDESNLLIPEKNLYTAIEVVTLIPVSGLPAFDSFKRANSWTRSWLPHGYGHTALPARDRQPRLKVMAEWAFNGLWPERLDAFLMRVTARRWRKKTASGKKNVRGMLMTMDASRHMARPQPGNYQKDLLGAHARKVRTCVQP